MQTFDREHSVWARFDVQDGERLMNIVKIIVSFLIRHGRNAWQLKKFSDRQRVRDFVL